MVIVFTGDGKGKTSAALGIALRACGHNLYVSVIQFIKQSTATGEEKAAERLAPELEFMSMGRGFVRQDGQIPLDDHKKAAQDALALARQRIASGSWNILILDEINNAVQLGLLDLSEVMDLVKKTPANIHLILTGREASPELIAAADMVTEMRCVKHPFDEGRPAQRGVDF